MCRSHEFEDLVYMDWFLRNILSPIGKYVTYHFPHTKEDALYIALKYDLIYDESGYVYTFLPDLPQPSVTNVPRASDAIDNIIGSLSHPQPPPYPQVPMSYGQPMRGTSSTYTYPTPDPSCANSYQSASTSYTYPHPNPLIPGSFFAQPTHPNVVTNPNYPCAHPRTPTPWAPITQPSMPLPPFPQQQPPP